MTDYLYEETCQACGAKMTLTECDDCAGEGEIQYGDRKITCAKCGGGGSFFVCPNAPHTPGFMAKLNADPWPVRFKGDDETL
jgi:hypothetical protein